MKRIFALGLIASLVGAIGCTTTPKEKSYTADSPPPLEKTSGKERVSLSPAMPEMKKRVSAAEIDEGNVLDKTRLLENDMRRDLSTAKLPAGR